jgi:pyruvate dehydrogenase E2 component (dihydrolipoamide acetyltransferase)
MASAIRLPDLGTNVEECKVLSWRVKEGEAVKRGQILADIETDKAVAELESTAEGVVLQLVVKAGEVARTGDILAYVSRPGEAVGDATKLGTSLGVAPTEARAPVTSAASRTLPTSATLSLGPAVSPSQVKPGSSVRVSLMVRNLAAKLGVDLSRVQGMGPGGMITREDVQRASQPPAGPKQGKA